MAHGGITREKYDELVAGAREQINEYRMAWQGDSHDARTARRLLDNAMDAMEIVVAMPNKGEISRVMAKVAIGHAAHAIQTIDLLREMADIRNS